MLSVLLTFEILTHLGSGLSDPGVDYHSCMKFRQHAVISDSSVCLVFFTDVPLCIAGCLFLTLWSEWGIKQSSTKLFFLDFSPMGRMKNKFNQRLCAIGEKKRNRLVFFQANYIFYSFSYFFIVLFSFSILSDSLFSRTPFLCSLFLSRSYVNNAVHLQSVILVLTQQ